MNCYRPILGIFCVDSITNDTVRDAVKQIKQKQKKQPPHKKKPGPLEYLISTVKKGQIKSYRHINR